MNRLRLLLERYWRAWRYRSALACLLLAGCARQAPANPKTAEARAATIKSGAECQSLGIVAIVTAKSCADARAVLDDLVRRAPECQQIFTGNRGFSIECSDGGGS